MLWGTFGIVHISSLVLAAGIVIGLYFLLRRRSEIIQLAVLGVLSFAGIAAIIFNLVTWGSPLEYLPFHLCSLNAMVLPIAVFTKSKVLNNLLLLWALGAIMALVVNTAQASFEIFSWTFVFYFFPHVLEFGIVVLMFCLGLVKKDIKCIGSTLGITLISYTAIHFINVALNRHCEQNNIVDYTGNVIRVNYMYSITPENPVLQLFYNLIPRPYWYMLLCVPVIVVYLVCVYSPQLIKLISGKRKTEDCFAS